MRDIFIMLCFFMTLGFGHVTKGKKSNLSQLNLSDFKLVGGEKTFLNKSPIEIIQCFKLHALPKTTFELEFECNFIVESSPYELKLELKKGNSGKWEIEEYEIDKKKVGSQEVHFSDSEMLNGPYSGFRNYYKSILERNYDDYLKYKTKKNKTRETKDRFLDLIDDEFRDKIKDGYSELEVIANSLPLVDPCIKGASRIEIKFKYLYEIKSKEGIMKVDFECLRQSGNPEIWIIHDSDAHFKEF